MHISRSGIANQQFQYISAPTVPPSDNLDAASPQVAAEQGRYTFEGQCVQHIRTIVVLLIAIYTFGCAGQAEENGQEELHVEHRDMYDVRDTLDVRKQRIYAIYKERLKSNPTLKGVVKLSFVISPSGTVQDLRILESDIGDPALESAIASIIERTVFSSQEVTPTNIEYDFVFTQN